MQFDLLVCQTGRPSVLLHSINGHSQLGDYSAILQRVRQEKKGGGGGEYGNVEGVGLSLDTKVSGVIAVTMPSGRSFHCLKMAGKNDACR